MRKEFYAWCIYFLLVLIWGSSFLLIKKSLLYFSNIQVSALRMIIAGLSLSPIILFNYKKIPLSHWKWVIACAVFSSIIPMFLFPLAQTKINSSISGVLNALVPMFSAIFGYVLYKNKIYFSEVIGIIICFVSVLFLALYKNSITNKDSWYAFYIVLATMSYGLSAVIYKNKLNDFPPIIVTSAMFACLIIPGFLLLSTTDFFLHLDYQNFKWQQSLCSIIILGVIVSAFANVLFYRIMSKSSAIKSTSITYLMPFVAIIWGILDGEHLALYQIVCFIVIILGIILVSKPTK